MKLPENHQQRMKAYAKRRALWRALIKRGWSMAAIAKTHNISRQAVRSALLNGR